MSDALDRRVASLREDLARQGLERSLPTLGPGDSLHYHLAGRPVVGLCSNDYLGLAHARRLAPDLTDAAPGAGASRLVSGNVPALRHLEETLAAWVGYPDAVLFPSGFQANVGTLPALLQDRDDVTSDRLCHASLIDGLRLSPARAQVVDHTRPPDAPVRADALRWWICESVFSMDGDSCAPGDLRGFLDAGGLVYLDEAHSLALPRDAPTWSAAHGLRPTVLLGTGGKALGCAGAFVAASTEVCNHLRARARSFVFSTGVSPLLARQLAYAVALVRGPEGDALRERLWTNVARLSRALDLPGPSPSPIFPVLVGDNARAVTIASALLRRGFHVQPIRPPTVPPGTARLRVTVSALHTPEDLDAFAHALRDELAAHGCPLVVERGRVTPVDLPP